MDTAEPPGGRLPSAEPHTDPLHILFHVDTARRSNHVKANQHAVIVLLFLLVDEEATAPADTKIEGKDTSRQNYLRHQLQLRQQKLQPQLQPQMQPPLLPQLRLQLPLPLPLPLPMLLLPMQRGAGV